MVLNRRYVPVRYLAIASITAALIMLPSVSSAQAPPSVFLLDATNLMAAQTAVRNGDPTIQAAVAALRKQADNALVEGPFTVTRKTQSPPSGDPHDYVSLSIYWWPDSASDSGLPYIQKDGVRNPESDDVSRYDANPLTRMVGDVETLSLAYFLTGDQRYASHATDLLRAWFLTPSTRMNPNFRYAQIIPGRDAVRGTGIIESRRFTRIVDSVGLLAGCACWSGADDQALRQWFGEFDNWLRTSPNGRMESVTTNNHAVWYDVQVLDFSLYAGNCEAARRISLEAEQGRIDSQIAADGSMPRELARTRSYHYSDFNLQAFAELATLASFVDVDLWGYVSVDSGAGIRSAVDFLVPYWAGSATWQYDEITDVKVFKENAQTLKRAAAAYPDGDYGGLLSQLSEGQSELDLLRLNLGFWPD